MELVKPALDVGLQIAAADPAAMLAFHRDVVGLHFDHDLPLGGGRIQSRHGWGDSVVKLNHARGGAAAGAPSGWRSLTLLDPDCTTARRLLDPEGNLVVHRPAAARALAIELHVADPVRTLDFLAGIGLPVDGDSAQVGASWIRVVGDASAPGAGLEGTGPRYVTFQVDRVDAAHAEALAAGGTEGMAPRTLGEVARISFVIEPGGNWIELSQRASLVGSLAP